MIVCICRQVSDRQIHQAVADGAESLECLQFELGVATQCGRCADCATSILCDARAAVKGVQPITVHRGAALQAA
jgi:bacterioferritin-associated ferredoxin